MNTYHVIGLMSGSSLDGLDIAYCQFDFVNNQWAYKILIAEVVPLPGKCMEDLKQLPSATAKTFCQVDARLGSFFGECVNSFIEKHALQDKVHFIASHGHTIFHFPDKKFTAQIGNGAALAATARLPVVCDFRTADIALGGQGTPIVPIGDKLLCTDYTFCLNIGGIANISGKSADNIVAFDICAANQVLNYLAGLLGQEYDANGETARGGNLDKELLAQLNTLEFYSRPYPKSLDNSFSREMVLPILELSDISIEDKLRTYTEHIAVQVAGHIKRIVKAEKMNADTEHKMLVTGGGAFNAFLLERINAQTKILVQVPGEELIKFKEAVVIALMGVLRRRNEVNVLSSVTGATKDSIGGAVYLP